MPEKTAARDRLYRRLAEGVQRTRLIEPIIATRPSLVVVSAPSGCGKTVLAAQLATSGAYDEVAWIDGGTTPDSAEEVAGLLLRLSGERSEPAGRQSNARGMCGGDPAAILAGASTLVVVDADDSVCTCDGLEFLRRLAVSAPMDSTILITTRATVGLSTLIREGCVVDSALLLFDDTEMSALWRYHCSGEPNVAQAEAVRRASGGHAALSSLACRRMAMLGQGATTLDRDRSLMHSVRSLLDAAAGTFNSQLLQVIAAARTGSTDLLTATVPVPDLNAALLCAASVMPLLSFGEAEAGGWFAAEPLLTAALGGARSLTAEHSAVLRSLVRGLVDADRPADALFVAIESGLADLTAEALGQVGPVLVASPDAHLVRAGLRLVPATDLSGSPALLALLAEDAWHTGRTLQALGAARLASQIAEATGDAGNSIRAKLMLARLRASVGDYEGIVAELDPMLATWRAIEDVEDVCALVAAGLLAYGFLGDRDGLDRCRSVARELAILPGITQASAARIDMVEGLVAALLEGDCPLAFERCRTAASRPHLSLNQQVGIVSNMATSALLAGMLSEARAAAEHGLSLVVGKEADSSVVSSMTMIRAMGRSLSECSECAKTLVEESLDAELRGNDRLSLTLTLAYGSVYFLLCRDGASAQSFAERAVRSALEMGSPVPLWFAELVQAQVCLATAETVRAAAIASRLLPEVEAIAAMGHVLFARLILAEVALRERSLASALEHISAVSDFIVEKTPAFVVASFVRAFPELLGPLAHVIGAERLPASVLRCLTGVYAAEALEAASQVLTKPEIDLLRTRLQYEAGDVVNAGREESCQETLCQVRMFGGLEVTTPHGIVGQRDWGKRKARLLFAMLVARHGTDIHRAELIEYLWPDLDEAHGINNFYVVWSAMKRAVAPGSLDAETAPPFENHNGVCRIIPGRVASDLDQFTAARAEARYAKSIDDTEAEVAALRTAIELYRGDVLPGDIYDDWFGSIRQRFRQEYQASVIRFSTLMLAADDPLAALPFVIEASERDSLREDLYQIRIKLEVASNQRGAAMGTYMSCRNTLIEELGIDPSRETVELYQQILAMEDGPETPDHGSGTVRNR